MSDHDLEQIAEIIAVRSYKKGAIIIEEMSEAERFFIIHKGKIEITKRYDGDEEFVLSVQSDGDFFGEMALLDEGRRSASVRAIEPTTVFEISRNDFETLLYKAPALAYRIMKELSARLRESGALLISHLKQRNRQLLQSYVETMRIVASSLPPQPEGRPPVADLMLAVGRELGVGDEELLGFEFGGLLHDLGARSPSGRSELERIIPQILGARGGFEGGIDAEQGKKATPAVDRLIALADAYAGLVAEGASSEKAILAELKEGVPERFDAEALKALGRVAAAKAHDKKGKHG